MSARKLTPTQHNILVWLADRDGRLLYGPMQTMATLGPSYGFVGGHGPATIRYSTGEALLKGGYIEHVSDKYPLGYYRISDLGRQSLPAPASCPGGEG